jgi:peptide deformylase
MAGYDIRIFGDPVLRQVSQALTDIDGTVAKLVEDMIPVMYQAHGLGLAAPQIGVQKRLFVYDMNDGRGPQTLINPEIKESSGEWTYEEGCLSVPGLSWEITSTATRSTSKRRSCSVGCISTSSTTSTASCSSISSTTIVAKKRSRCSATV